MARIRTIKPEFFRNYELYQRESDANRGRTGRQPYLNLRTAFAGIITAADRVGRFKWRPAELKLDCLPHDPVDFSEVMAALAGAPNPFIVRYEVDGQEYGLIPGFLKHQRPRPDEAQSVLPAPPEVLEPFVDRSEPIRSPTRTQPVSDQYPTSTQSGSNRCKEGKGREGKGTEITAPEQPAADLSPVYPPKLTPLQAVMRAYKVGKGINPDDKDWDKANWKTHCKAAKKLLDAFKGDDRAAVTYLLGKIEGWNEGGVSWVLATVAKHAWDDRGKIGQVHDSADAVGLDGEAGKMGTTDELAGRGRSRITSTRGLANEVLRQIGNAHCGPGDDGPLQPQQRPDSVLGPDDA